MKSLAWALIVLVAWGCAEPKQYGGPIAVDPSGLAARLQYVTRFNDESNLSFGSARDGSLVSEHSNETTRARGDGLTQCAHSPERNSPEARSP